MAEQRLAREGWQNLGDHAERRQDHDVDLGVPEEPENVLVHDRVAATGCEEEARAEELVCQQHRDRASENRHNRKQQVGCDQPGPDKHGHADQ